MSIDRVREEIERGRDDLTDWVSNRMPDDCFATTNDKPVLESYAEVISWVQAQPQFLPEAKAEFLQSSDG